MVRQNPKKPVCLVVHPPLSSPAVPSFKSAVAAGCLSNSGIDVYQYDANIDFFHRYLFSGAYLSRCLETIREKTETGELPEHLLPPLEKTYHRLSEGPSPLDTFQSEAFYDPDAFLEAKNRADDMLLLISYACHPARIRFRSLSCKAAGREKSGIFIPLCTEGLFSKLNGMDADTAVFLLVSEHQKTAVTDMTAFISDTFPDITVAVVAKSPLGYTPVSEKTAVFPDMEGLCRWMTARYGIPVEMHCEAYDFRDLPLKSYAVPVPVRPSGTSLYIEHPSENCFSRSVSMDTPDTRYDDGLQMVQWTGPETASDPPIAALFDLSKQGVWNHVRLSDQTDPAVKEALLTFISLNPNIAHSYEMPHPPADTHETKDFDRPRINQIPDKYNPYAAVGHLKGEPFWKILEDPVYMLLYLNRFGKKALFSMRTDSENQSVLTLGKGVAFHYEPPGEIGRGLMDTICRMVAAGGAVDTGYVRYNLERAYLIGYAVENGQVVGNSSLKHPRPEFIERLNSITGLDFNHFVERGYTSVRPEYRAMGIGATLLEGLTRRAGNYKIFSLIGEDNTATQKMALRSNTRKIAVYYSHKTGKDMGVWMPVHMIEADWDITP